VLQELLLPLPALLPALPLQQLAGLAVRCAERLFPRH
jgi:hypothetical protein